MKSNDIHHSMTHGRTGKIARLPHSIRQQLNQRLGDGESGGGKAKMGILPIQSNRGQSWSIVVNRGQSWSIVVNRA